MSRESDELEAGAEALWLIDGYNVLRVSLSRESSEAEHAWWSAERRNALLELASRLPVPRAEVWVVFDGKHLRESSCPPARTPDAAARPPQAPRSVGCVFAPSADEWILQALRAHRRGAAATGSTAVVVTADRPLASRSRALGARIVSTGRFVERCGGS